jgi:hypothetical protein
MHATRYWGTMTGLSQSCRRQAPRPAVMPAASRILHRMPVPSQAGNHVQTRPPSASTRSWSPHPRNTPGRAALQLATPSDHKATPTFRLRPRFAQAQGQGQGQGPAACKEHSRQSLFSLQVFSCQTTQVLSGAIRHCIYGNNLRGCAITSVKILAFAVQRVWQ